MSYLNTSSFTPPLVSQVKAETLSLAFHSLVPSYLPSYSTTRKLHSGHIGHLTIPTGYIFISPRFVFALSSVWIIFPFFKTWLKCHLL